MNLGCGESAAASADGSAAAARYDSTMDTEQSFLQQVGPSACAELFAAPDRT